MCHMEHSPYRSYQLQNTRFKRSGVTRTVFSEPKEKLEISPFSWTIGLSQAWGDVFFFPINCLHNSPLRCAHRSCQVHDMTRYVRVRVGQLQKSQTSQTVHVVEKLQNPLGTQTETKLVYTGMQPIHLVNFYQCELYFPPYLWGETEKKVQVTDSGTQPFT